MPGVCCPLLDATEDCSVILLYLYSLCLCLFLQFLLLALQSGPQSNDRPDVPLTLHAFSRFILPGAEALITVCLQQQFVAFVAFLMNAAEAAN